MLDNSIPSEASFQAPRYNVWDPFMGTGTTAFVVMEKPNCWFYGGDKDVNLLEEVHAKIERETDTCK